MTSSCAPDNVLQLNLCNQVWIVWLKTLHLGLALYLFPMNVKHLRLKRCQQRPCMPNRAVPVCQSLLSLEQSSYHLDMSWVQQLPASLIHRIILFLNPCKPREASILPSLDLTRTPNPVPSLQVACTLPFPKFVANAGHTRSSSL